MDETPRTPEEYEAYWNWKEGDLVFKPGPYWDLTVPVRTVYEDGQVGVGIEAVETKAQMDQWLALNGGMTIEQFVERFPEKYKLMPPHLDDQYFPHAEGATR